jgi:drug/metabolite transporter (DMT)-like permease
MILVQKNHVPFVILLNYLWPTGIILFSILIAGTKVTRKPAFIIGTCVVLCSLAIELINGREFSALFENAQDCVAYSMAFLAALTWSFYSALSRRVGADTGGSDAIPFFQLSLGVVVFPLSFFPHLAAWENLTLGWGILLGGYALLQFVAFLSWDFGVRHGNIVILSLFADFIPWLSLFTSHVLVDVPISRRTIYAVVSLVFGAMITRYGTLGKKAASINSGSV